MMGESVNVGYGEPCNAKLDELSATLQDVYDIVVVPDTEPDIDSLLYKINEVERHLHSYGIVLAKLAVPAGGKVCNKDGVVPFQITVGANGSFGTPLLVMDTNDTPIRAGNVKFDPHQIIVFGAASANRIFRFRIATGNGGAYADWATAVAAGFYYDVVFQLVNTSKDAVLVAVQTRRTPVGSKMWVAGTCNSTATTVDFMMGIHEYEF